MPRTTDELVGGVIEVDASIPLLPFITIANELVTECCTGTKGPTPEYEPSRLEIIETWLAAHFYEVRDKRASAERAGSVSQNFDREVALNLNNSQWGQTAMLLDTNGGLAALSKDIEKGRKRVVGVTWLGTSHRQDADYFSE
jgi:hypothetical protein